MEYVIKSIKHSGRRGKRNTARVDRMYPSQIGCVVDIDPTVLVKWDSCVIDYVRDRDGTDLSGTSLWTSIVVDVQVGEDNLVIETSNTIYEMVRC
ncbi:MAG: hypothetical protein J6S14_20845 [Clostridia bacterium]|nr:hypothetical protein [Clostridia bacterium]